MVAAGIADTAEVKRSLKYYVNNFLSKEIGKTPLQHDTAFHQTNDDIRNQGQKDLEALKAWSRKRSFKSGEMAEE